MTITNSSLGSQRKTLIRFCLDHVEGCLDKALIDIISPNLDNHEDLLSSKSRNKLSNWIKENNKEVDIYSIILNLDFSEKVSNLGKYKDFLEPKDRDHWVKNLSRMNSINDLRNLVSHRSSETEDLEITEEHKSETWDHITYLRQSNTKIWNPLDKITESIDFLDFSEESTTSLFNFKPPDYLIHGFVGRHRLFTSICESLTEGTWNAVLIYGPGGIGKSALADYVSRHLDALNIYDKIIWFSDKRKVFDLHGSKVVNYENISSLESFKNKPIDEIDKSLKEICSEERCLIVLDNLETMLEEGNEFIREFSNKNTQFLVTSRINDCPGTQFRVSELEKGESLQLFNNISEIYNIREAINISLEEKESLLESIEFHPLYIKWILFQLQKGSTLSGFKGRQSLVQFCFDGLIDKISEESKEILKILGIADREMSIFQIQILMDGPDLDLHISELIKTSLVKTTKKFNSTYISLNSNVKTILKENTLEDLQHSLQLESAIKSMYKGLSKIGDNNKDLAYTNPNSYDVENEHDAVIVWHIHEIQFQNKSFEQIIKKMRKSLEISQSFHLYCKIGNIYAENQMYQDSIEYLESALQNANNGFRKKKALHFLIQSHEGIYDYKSCLDYSLKLNSIDPESEIPKHHLLSAYFGTNQFKKALEISSSIFESIDIENAPTREINRKFTSFIKVLSKSSRELDDYNEYKNIHDIVLNYVTIITPVIDQWSLKSLLRFLTDFYSRYSILCKKLMFDPELEDHLIRDRIVEKLESTKQRTVMKEFVQSWDFSQKKLDLENIPIFDLSEDFNEIRERNLNSKILNISFDKGKSFQGTVQKPRYSKTGDLVGWYVRNNEDDALCFCFCSDLPANVKVGFNDNFVCIKKDINNFVVKRSRNIVADISDDFIKENLRKGLKYQGVVVHINRKGPGYVLVELSVFGRSLTGMLSAKHMNESLRRRFQEVLYLGAEADFRILDAYKDNRDNGKLKINLEI